MGREAAWGLVEELLRTGVALVDVFDCLLEEIPEDAFGGEDRALVLLEMIVGTSWPAIRAVGEEEARVATALIGAIGESVLRDLRTAAALAEAGETG